MCSIKMMDKTYNVDSKGFLLNYNEWDEDFAQGMAPKLHIENGLTKKHWEVIRFIRKTFEELGKCPLVYQTCKMNGLRLRELEALFPTGYQRGACKLAGLTYKEGYLAQFQLPIETDSEHADSRLTDKTYRIDIRGFLVNPSEWDGQFASYKAFEMKMPGILTEEHWKILYYLRDYFERTKSVPTVFETCRDNNLEIEELEKLFPDGYHRGAVKLAGLRIR